MQRQFPRRDKTLFNMQRSGQLDQFFDDRPTISRHGAEWRRGAGF